ncbi:kinase-like domain-containing protein [Cadophora sp. MPI-SDFR-AT-0126]|nr:kinase-like domain-containing protein [Leotiomycetes sp. MPI-SDFR-AT-0126]
MAQHDEHAEVQAFHAFLRKNISYAVVDPNSASARRGFQSIRAIREYFEQNGSARLRELLSGVWYPDEPLVDPDDILQNYIAVFCILVELGKGTFIDHFSSRDLSDLRLPFDPGQSPPTHFPTLSDDPNFFHTFCNMQWKYCAPEFKYPMMNIHFEDQRILPIVSKELIAGGGSALLYRVRLHAMYNRLDPRKPTSSEPRANTYALKTYTAPDAAVYYKNEVNAFRRLKRSQTPSLIGFYGSFIQGHTFNIILEYADQGTLEHYFSDTSPPSRGVDIINFWESLFRTIWGLKCIHEVDGRGASDGPQILHGFHQDIKPANFLVCSNGEASKYSWQFKLADLGLSHFNKIAEGLGVAIANDAQGTRTYGAPECYRGDDFTDRGIIKIEQRVDIWSLGCIFSEAAIWIAHGYNGLEDYRRSRRLATNHIDGFRESDCFHDGQDVLPTVHSWHLDALPVLRQADFITKDVLSLAEQDMLVKAEYRATAHQLWGKAVKILQRANDQLDQLNLAHSSDISSGDTSTRSPRQISPESPPVASSSKFKSGAVVVQGTQRGGRSPPRQPPELPPSGSPPSRHQSTLQGSKGHKQRSSAHGESSGHYSMVVLGGRREYSPDRLPSRKSTRTTQRSTSADFDGNDWQRSKVSFSNPENHYKSPQQSPDLVESLEPDDNILELQQQRPATTPSRSKKGSRQGSNYFQGEDNEEEMHHRRGAFGGSYAHANLQFRERRETQSSTATTATEDDLFTPAPIPRAPEPMSKAKRMAPSKKTYKAKGKEPKQEKPSLSVAKASVWKIQSQAQKTIGFGTSKKIRLGPDPDPLPHGYLLERLERRDHTFLIDNSESMKAHWEEVTILVGILAYMVKPFDANGLEMMYTISSSKSITSKNSSKLVTSLEKTKPAGMSDISIRLNSILEQYKSKIHEVYGAGSKVTAKARSDVRPLTLYVLTDGVWQPKCDAETPIKNLVRKLLELKVSPKQVGVQFIYFGNNPIGKARVTKLDDKIIIEGSDTQLDIVDTEPSNGNVWKMLLGSIDPYFDNSDDDDDDDDDDDENDYDDEEKPRHDPKGKGPTNGNYRH